MPSNTAHIQQRAQLKQHDDLTIAAVERNEWQDGQNELGLPSIPGVHSRPAPTKQGPDSSVPQMWRLRDCWKEMPNMQDTNLATQARASSKVIRLLGSGAKTTKAAKTGNRTPPATFHEAQGFDDRNDASWSRCREYAATVSS
ncbi:hypothetical protein QM012_004071 [Aureobasidium pullulans]|uniref:Uncharacterized protein n=1 Tax=Aureobasidium pullulans TaxID=5580 RepID=A0ABR0T6M9_AURPU